MLLCIFTMESLPFHPGGRSRTWATTNMTVLCSPPPLSPPGECDCRSPTSHIRRLSAPQQPRQTAKVHLISSPPLGKPRQAEPRDQAPCRRGGVTVPHLSSLGWVRKAEWVVGRKAQSSPLLFLSTHFLHSWKLQDAGDQPPSLTSSAWEWKSHPNSHHMTQSCQ